MHARNFGDLLQDGRQFGGCELVFREKHGLMRNPAFLRGVKRAAEQSCVSVYSVHLPNHPLNENGNSWVSVVSSIRNVDNFFSPQVVVHHPLYGSFDLFKRNLRRVLEAMPDWVTLVVENLLRHGANLSNLKSIEKLTRGMHEYQHFGVCIDTCHVPYKASGDPTDQLLDFFAACGPFLKHVHASDVSLSTGETHLPLGEGDIRWEKVKEYLDKNYSGKVTLEYYRQHRGKLARAKEFWDALG